MATLNKTTGLYEARKLFNHNNQEYVGTGDSKEAAKKDLKRQLDEIKIDYSKTLEPGLTDAQKAVELKRIEELVNTGKIRKYAPPMENTGDTSLRSPGYAVLQDEQGRVRYDYSEGRVITVTARPDLAKAIREKTLPQPVKSTNKEALNGA